MSTATRTHFTTGELGDLLGVQAWKIARLFETGALPEPDRIAGRRMIPRAIVPDIIDALRARGWSPGSADSSTSVQDR